MRRSASTAKRSASSPTSPKPSSNRAIARTTRATWTARLQDFRRGHPSSKPDVSRDAYSQPGQSLRYRGKGDLDGALADYDEAIRLKPGYSARLLQPGRCALSTKATWTARSQDLQRGHPSQARLCRSFDDRGIVRISQGDLEARSRTYDEAIRLEARLTPLA